MSKGKGYLKRGNIPAVFIRNAKKEAEKKILRRRRAEAEQKEKEEPTGLPEEQEKGVAPEE